MVSFIFIVSESKPQSIKSNISCTQKIKCVHSDNRGHSWYLLCCLVHKYTVYISYNMYSSKIALKWSGWYCGCSVEQWLCTATAQYRWSHRLVFIVFHSCLPGFTQFFFILLCCCWGRHVEATSYKYFQPVVYLHLTIYNKKKNLIPSLCQTFNHCEEEKEENLFQYVTEKFFSETHSSLKWVGSSLRRGEAHFFAGCNTKFIFTL